MSKTRLLCAGLLVSAMMLGTGCKTMAAGERGSPQTPAMGGSGLDPNPDHNIPNSPTGIDASPFNSDTPGGELPSPLPGP